MKFLPLGGADEIGASCFYLNISGTGLLLDCGTHPRKIGLEALPDFNLLIDHPLDFVFISHAHQDHIGSLPFLIQQFPHVIIYSTYQTKEIAEVTLHNAVNILAQKLTESDELKIYTHDEIELLVRSIQTVEYNQVISLKGLRHNGTENINITFYDAGHILGSACILIEYNGHRIFYTGDINLSNQSIMIEADISGVRNIGTLIMETTYGSTESEKLGSWKSEVDRFTKAANSILNNGGSVLVPVFALGKTQEMLAIIHEQIRKGKLTNATIYTGGVGKEISNIYDRSRYTTRRSDPEFELKEIPQVNLLQIEDYNEFKKNPGIVLASSGMMIEGTISFRLLDYWLAQNNFAIYGVGYMDSAAPGFRVMNSMKGGEIYLTDFSPKRKVQCEIDRFYFPSHSKREELIKIVNKTNPKRVILIHGESIAKDWVGMKILEKFNHIKVHSAQNRKQILL